MPTNKNGNIANLNINVTSNISDVSKKLTKLEAQLKGLKAGVLNFKINTNGFKDITSSMKGMTNSLRSVFSTGSSRLNNVANTLNRSSENMNKALQNTSNRLVTTTEGIVNAATILSSSGKELGVNINGGAATLLTAVTGLRLLNNSNFRFRRNISSRQNNIPMNQFSVPISSQSPQRFNYAEIFQRYIRENRSPDIIVSGAQLESRNRYFRDLIRDRVGRTSTSIVNTGRGVGNLLSESSEAIGHIFRGLTSSSGAVTKLTSLFFGLGGVAKITFDIIISLATTAITTMATLAGWVAKTGFEYNIMAENAKVGLDVLIKGQKEVSMTGTSMFEDIQELARITPFKTTELAESGQLLMNYGVQAKKVLPLLRMLGDVSGGDPQKLDRMTLAVAQMQALGRLQSRDLLQMVSAGFNPLKEIGEARGITDMGKVTELMEKGEITAGETIRAFQKATSEGGRFYQMMEKKGKTFSGRWSTLLDTLDITSGAGMEGLFKLAGSSLNYLIKLIEKIDLTELTRLGKLLADRIYPSLVNIAKTISSGFNFKTLEEGFSEIGEIIVDLLNGFNVFIKLSLFSYNVFTLTLRAAKLLVMGTTQLLTNLGVRVSQFLVGFVGVIIGALDNVYTILKSLIINAGRGIVNFTVKLVEVVGKLGEEIALKFARTALNPMKEGLNELAEYIGQEVFDIKITKSESNLKKILDVFSGPDMLPYENYENSSYFEKSLGKIKEWGTKLEEENKIYELKMKQTNENISEDFMDIKNLFSKGDTNYIDQLLSKLKEMSSSFSYKVDDDFLTGWPDTSKDSKDNKEKENGLNKIGEAVKNIGEEFQKATDSIITFGKSFDKMSYERFSPSKLKSRINRTLKEFTSWQSNLNILGDRGLDSKSMNQLREMGISGFGITKGLAKASNPNFDQIRSAWSGISNISDKQAAIIVNHEHSGVIKVDLGDEKSMTINIGAYLANEINKNASRYSVQPIVR